MFRQFLKEVDIVQSSVNNINLKKFDEPGKSFMKMRNSRGPRIEPCGTPCVNAHCSDSNPLTTVV